jgi:aspartyl-tRNA(Asn)/glutamyl-tRNA(Gln) amidotransferase subunit B
MSKPEANAYETIIGLEVHVQLLTKTKLFCGCSTEFGLPPNSATCPICIGMPGVLPVMNRQAFELALKAALALNCNITPHTKWDRKNYYYPDLPKNYQISQYDLPFSTGGYLEIEIPSPPTPLPQGARGESTKRIGLIRVHLEEDAGKMMHDESGRGRDSKVDLNRAGTPLLEIVSQPDMRSPEEAKAYLEELRLLLREIGVSDCEMQEGSLRVDANVNIKVPVASGGRQPSEHAATPIVEVKNLNSFRAVERAMAYEAERQYDEFKKTGKRLGEVPKATAGWDDQRGVTVIQRRKEEASDYRYFHEPDLVPVEVDDAWLGRVKASMGELPAARRKRFQVQYSLTPYDAGVLVSQGHAFADYFEETAKLAGDAKAASNWCTNQVLHALNDKKLDIATFPLRPPAVADLVMRVKKHNINAQRAREVFSKMVETSQPAEAIIKQLGLDVSFDSNQLRELVKKAIAGNPKAVADVKAGKTKAIDALVGPVMRETKGKAPTDEIRKLLTEELAKA